jgi:hypothetical protein
MTVAKHIPADFACSACGSKTPFEIAIQHEGASRVVTRCLHALGDFGHGLLAYAALFRPKKKRLTWEKLYRVIDEVLIMRDAGVITRDGETIAVTEAIWIESFAACVDAAAKSLTLPLDSHGYLLEIIARKGKTIAAANERAVESVRRGDTPIGYSAAHATAQPAPPARDYNSYVQTFNRARFYPPQTSADAAAKAEPARAEMPADVREKLAPFLGRARADQSKATVDPLVGKTVRIAVGEHKGKLAEVLRVAGETEIRALIRTPRNGERVIVLQRNEVTDAEQ